MKRTVCLLGLLLFAAGCRGTQSTAASPAQQATPSMPTLEAEQIALGRDIYVQQCARCHGANLEGEANWKEQNEDRSFRPPPHDATGHTWHHSDTMLTEAIEQGGARLPATIGGPSTMPAFGEVLTDEEIAAVLSYIKSSCPDDVRAVQ